MCPITRVELRLNATVNVVPIRTTVLSCSARSRNAYPVRGVQYQLYHFAEGHAACNFTCFQTTHAVSYQQTIADFIGARIEEFLFKSRADGL